MAFATLNFQSPALSKACSMTVILPERTVGTPPFPVFYLLHGLSDDHTSWSRRTSIERHVADLPLIIVMPDGGRGFYCDAVDGPAYERHLLEDVMGFVDRTFHTIAARQGRVIGGLSMGGYGAIKLALKFPQFFCSAVSHSAALDVRRRIERPEISAEMRRIFGPSPGGGPDDPYALAETIDCTLLPALRIDCGLEDGLLEKTAFSIATLSSSPSRMNTPSSPARTPGTTGTATCRKRSPSTGGRWGSATEEVKG